MQEGLYKFKQNMKLKTELTIKDAKSIAKALKLAIGRSEMWSTDFTKYNILHSAVYAIIDLLNEVENE